MAEKALTWAEKAVIGIVCCGCEYVDDNGCNYEKIRGIPLPYPMGTKCLFNPHRPGKHAISKNTPESSGNILNKPKIYERTEKEMPAKIEIDEEKALTLYEQGQNDAEIAASLGCSAQTIGRWRAGRGLKGRKGIVPTKRKTSTRRNAPDLEKPADGPEDKLNMKRVCAALGSEAEPPKPEKKPLSSLDTLISQLRKLSGDYSGAEIRIDGLPIKSVTVLSEYDLLGKLIQTQVDLLTE